MYWCIFLYHKCKIEYIELTVMKIILIKINIEKKYPLRPTIDDSFENM